MLTIASLLLILCISLIITRMATVALVLTGMTRQAARFQARSAFSGAGFTTSESEQIVNHPLRRWIIRQLMLWGNIGIVSVLCSVTLSAVHSAQWDWVHWTTLIGGVIAFYFTATNKAVEHLMARFFGFLLRPYIKWQPEDYTRLLHVDDHYGVQMIALGPDSPKIGTTLGELIAGEPNLRVLGVQHATGEYLGVPEKGRQIQPGDQLVVYGHVDQIEQFRRSLCKPSPEEAAVSSDSPSEPPDTTSTGG
jgi:hypothetical protein